MSDTPASISAEMQEADSKLKQLADQTAWFKGQRDYWRSLLELKLAIAKTADKGPATKAKEAAVVAIWDNIENQIPVPWMNNHELNIIDMVTVCDAAYELVAKRYDYYESHLMTLMARNKNVLVDYNSSSAPRKGY